MLLQIPDDDREVLQLVLNLPTERTGALSDAIGNAKPTLRLRELVDQVAASAGGSSAEIEDIVGLLASLRLVRVRLGQELEEFLDELFAAAQRQGLSSPRGWEEAKELFRTLLSPSNAALELVCKTSELILEHERLFCSARIVTELRPVFANVDEPPAGAVIQHILRVHYHGTGGSEVYFALDGDDVRTLVEALQRALQKESSLENLLKANRIATLAGRREKE